MNVRSRLIDRLATAWRERAVVLKALSFGLVGIFVGPVVLAVTYTLVDAWVLYDNSGDAPVRVEAGGRE